MTQPRNTDPNNNPTSNTGPNVGRSLDSNDDTNAIVTLLLDRSGSMSGLAGAVVEGVNHVLTGLRPGDRVTVVQFDSVDPFDVMIDGVPAAEVTPLADGDFEPRGGTPLYDAVGTAIARTAGRVREFEILNDSTPGVVLAILTDGYENASSEYSAEQVRRLIERCREDGWTITYVGLGLGDAAFAEGARLGIDASQVYSMSANALGTAEAFSSVLSSTADSRSSRRQRRS
jgi:hypothetical protein